MQEVIHFILNGKDQAIELEPNEKLLYTLRNICNEKSVRFGCGSGNCGACTVLIDGVPEQSCNISNWAIQNREIVTSAGLEIDRVGKVVVDAFVIEQAAQCGYCLSGIVMSVTALLKMNVSPSRDDINKALSRHLCRCGTHIRILRAIARAACNLGAG